MTGPPNTIAKLQTAIEAIIEKRAREAARMQYDQKVWTNAVSAARDVYTQVPVATTAKAYHQAVVKALAAARDAYNDPDGEYTNGTGAIGDVLYDVMGLHFEN